MHSLTPDTTGKPWPKPQTEAPAIQVVVQEAPPPRPSPIHDQAKKATTTDSILLTIGIILDGTERDLVWALWAIQRELERRRG